MKREFRVGDRVTAFGLKGTVSSVSEGLEYQVEVENDCGNAKEIGVRFIRAKNQKRGVNNEAP